MVADHLVTSKFDPGEILDYLADNAAEFATAVAPSSTALMFESQRPLTRPLSSDAIFC